MDGSSDQGGDNRRIEFVDGYDGTLATRIATSDDNGDWCSSQKDQDEVIEHASKVTVDHYQDWHLIDSDIDTRADSVTMTSSVNLSGGAMTNWQYRW